MTSIRAVSWDSWGHNLLLAFCSKIICNLSSMQSRKSSFSLSHRQEKTPSGFQNRLTSYWAQGVCNASYPPPDLQCDILTYAFQLVPACMPCMLPDFFPVAIWRGMPQWIRGSHLGFGCHLMALWLPIKVLNFPEVIFLMFQM